MKLSERAKDVKTSVSYEMPNKKCPLQRRFSVTRRTRYYALWTSEKPFLAS